MARIPGKAGLPLGKDTPMNVAVQRPTVNVKEAENVGEQAAAVVKPEGFRFYSHGTFGPQRLTEFEKIHEK